MAASKVHEDVKDEDVDDYPLAEEGDVWASEASEIVAKGNQLFRNGDFKEAIAVYSKGLQKFGPGPILLSNRIAAYCKWSQFIRSIPAAVSEERAIFERDPIFLVQLALKDADKLVKLFSDWPKAHLRKGTALMLSEQYADAREAYLSGLQLDPTNVALQAALSVLISEERNSKETVSERRKAKIEHCDDFDCNLCLKLLFNPVTTPCGHSFCRSCLMQALDHGNKCPMCRTVLFVSPRTYPISVTLNNVIKRYFPEEYAERKAETEETTSPGSEILPLFVMDFVLPCEKMCLNIFEPRYRLMIRRVMEGNHRMGMVGMDSQTGNIADVCCEVEIRECDPLPDGRFLIQVEGRRRCHIIRTWEQDGYRIGQVQVFGDSLPCEESSDSQELLSLATSARDMANNWISELRAADRNGRLSELLMRAEGMPEVSDPENFSFWVANLISTRSSEKLELIRMVDAKLRLTRVLSRLKALRNERCTIQ